MKTRFTFILSVIFLIGLRTFANGTTVTLTLSPCDASATVDNYDSTMNFANMIDYYSGAWTISSTPTIWRNLFKFNLSCIPTNATIQSASLSLFWADTSHWGNNQHSSTTNSNESVIQQVTSAWDQNTVTWVNQPSATTANQVILPQSTSGTQDYPNIDVTTMVQQMLSSTNYGFLLKLTNEVPYARMIFASGNNPHINKRPILDITYTVPTTACVTLQLNGCDDDNATVDNYDSTMNFVNMIDYYAGAWTISSTPTTWRNLFRFNHLSCIPSNAIVQSASLSLFWADTSHWGNIQHSSATNSNESVIQQVTSAWDQNAVTWVNQPSATTANQVILPQSTSGTQDYPNIDVTTMVQQMVSSTNYGFLLKLTNEVPYARMIFASGNNPHMQKRPTLTICFTAPLLINEISKDGKISIYPNPSNGFFNISLDKYINHGQLNVFNEIGTKVYSELFNGKEKILNYKLSEGIYLLQVVNGNEIWTEKIISE